MFQDTRAFTVGGATLHEILSFGSVRGCSPPVYSGMRSESLDFLCCSTCENRSFAWFLSGSEVMGGNTMVCARKL